MSQILDAQTIADYDRDGAVVIRKAFAPHWVGAIPPPPPSPAR